MDLRWVVLSQKDFRTVLKYTQGHPAYPGPKAMILCPVYGQPGNFGMLGTAGK